VSKESGVRGAGGVQSTTFAKRAVLVTGGGTGIGRSIALAFAAAGAKVAISGRRAGPLEAVARELGDQGIAVRGDVSERGESARIIGEVTAALGGLDVLVNNAGVYPLGPLVQASDDDLWAAFATNVIAPMALIRDALPALRVRPGVVVNIGSTVARISKANMAAYSASKFALEQATRSLAVELGPQGIRVNCVAPGMTGTDMIAHLRANPKVLQAYLDATPLGRVGEPDDLARVVLSVASDEFAWVTGQIIQCSGGFQL
jgi:meso-butanediol dehydrogenase / (S,S)-butanediol dehydrogenase / diacetyl reductase